MDEYHTEEAFLVGRAGREAQWYALIRVLEPDCWRNPAICVAEYNLVCVWPNFLLFSMYALSKGDNKSYPCNQK